MVDTTGFDDGGARVSAQLTEVLGEPVVASASGRWRLWDLRKLPVGTARTETERWEAARDLVGPELLTRLDLDHPTARCGADRAGRHRTVEPQRCNFSSSGRQIPTAAGADRRCTGCPNT